jgi:hypothetical protein
VLNHSASLENLAGAKLNLDVIEEKGLGYLGRHKPSGNRQRREPFRQEMKPCDFYTEVSIEVSREPTSLPIFMQGEH